MLTQGESARLQDSLQFGPINARLELRRGRGLVKIQEPIHSPQVERSRHARRTAVLWLDTADNVRAAAERDKTDVVLDRQLHDALDVLAALRIEDKVCWVVDQPIAKADEVAVAPSKAMLQALVVAGVDLIG